MMKFSWPRQYVPCNLCGSDDRGLLFHQDQHGLGLHTVMCRKCGLIYLNPRPTAGDYDRFYRDWYHQLYPSRAAFHAGSLGRRIVHEVARQRIEFYRPYLNGEVRLLEVGCGEGAFLAAGREINPGWKLQGVDVSPKEVAACKEKNLDVTCGRLEGVSMEGATHIAAFHVLEHALDPLALLRAMACRLRSEGYLLLEVPNILGRWQGLGMLHLAHPYQFAAASLGKMLERAGFSVILCREIEHALLPSSLRLVARRVAPTCSTEHSIPSPEMPSFIEVRAMFRRKLAHWRRDLILGRLVRCFTSSLSPGMRTRIWEHTAGRRWRQLLASPARTSAALSTH